MAFRSWDVCTDPVTGAFHWCSSVGDVIEIDGIVQGPQPESVLFPRIESNGAVSAVVFKGHTTGTAFMKTNRGARFELSGTHGNQPTAIAWLNNQFVIALAQYECWFRWLVDATGFVGTGPQNAGDNPNKGASGFLDFNGVTPIWTDLHRSVTVHTINAGDQILTLPKRRGRYTVGQANVGPDQVAVFDHETSTIYTIWKGSTQVPSGIAVSGTQLRVAISGEGVDRLYTENDLAPFDTSFVPPPFTVEPMSRPMAVGCFMSKRDAPGNCVIFPHDTADRPSFDTDADEPLRPAMWTDAVRDSAGNVVQTLEQVIAFNRSDSIFFRVPLAIYVDGPWVDPQGILQSDVRMVQAYRARGESYTDFLWRIGTEVEMSPAGRFMLVAGAFDRNGDLSESEMAEAFKAYRELWDHNRCVGVVFFAWDRANGVTKYPWMIPMIQAFADASPGLPDLTLPATVDPPKPTDPPKPDPPTPPEPIEEPEMPKLPMKEDAEYRAFIKDTMGPMLVKIGIANGAGLAQGVGDTFRDVARWGDKARDPLVIEYELFAKAYAGGQSPDQEPALSLVKECLSR